MDSFLLDIGHNHQVWQEVIYEKKVIIIKSVIGKAILKKYGGQVRMLRNLIERKLNKQRMGMQVMTKYARWLAERQKSIVLLRG